MSRGRVVPERVREESELAGKLPEAERLRLLAAFDALVAKIPATSSTSVARELRRLRTARSAGR